MANFTEAENVIQREGRNLNAAAGKGDADAVRNTLGLLLKRPSGSAGGSYETNSAIETAAQGAVVRGHAEIAQLMHELCGAVDANYALRCADAMLKGGAEVGDIKTMELGRSLGSKDLGHAIFVAAKGGQEAAAYQCHLWGKDSDPPGLYGSNYTLAEAVAKREGHSSLALKCHDWWNEVYGGMTQPKGTAKSSSSSELNRTDLNGEK